MNYEQKYKEALERAKKLYGQGTITESLGYVFPELAESEDERIRRGIVRNLEYLKSTSDGFVAEELQERIDWLEKQSKKLDAEKVIDWWLDNYHPPIKLVAQFKHDFDL